MAGEFACAGAIGYKNTPKALPNKAKRLRTGLANHQKTLKFKRLYREGAKYFERRRGK
jgi:hypothetical protein